MFYCLFVGFNVETIEHKGVSFVTWDVGGRDKSVSLSKSLSLCL